MYQRYIMLIWGSIGLYPLIYWIRDLHLDNFDFDLKKIVNYFMKWRNDITKFGSAFFECKFFCMSYLVNLIEFNRRQVNEVTFQIHKNKPTKFKPPFFLFFSPLQCSTCINLFVVFDTTQLSNLLHCYSFPYCFSTYVLYQNEDAITLSTAPSRPPMHRKFGN